MKKFLAISAIATLGALVYFLWLEYSSKHAKNNLAEPAVFEVFTGDDAFDISRRLENESFVSSRFAFLWNVARERKLHSFVAGRYRLAEALSPAEVVLALTGGKAMARDIRVTFPEGFTAKQMTLRLTASKLPGEAAMSLIGRPKDEWRSSYTFLSDLPTGAGLEGFLFPDTYFFAEDASAEIIVEKMLKTFETRVNAPLREALTFKAGNLYKAVTLASIVEQEVQTPNDRKMVSDLFLRRLAIGQALQSDATVRYISGIDKIQHSIEETRIPSLYNTYLHPGLPPGPISNPGLVSLESVARPIENSFFYFLSNPKTSKTVFAETFEEHVQNKNANGL